MITLVFIGKHEHHLVRRDPIAFEKMLRSRYPRLSEVGLAVIVQRELANNPPRYDAYVQHILGRDILSDDPRTIPAWPWMAQVQRNDLVDPLTGEVRSIKDRETLLDDDCITETTYVWRKQNGWTQEVSDNDAALIRASKGAHWFKRLDDGSLYVPNQVWSLPSIETHNFRSVGEYLRFRKEDTRRPQWLGR